MSEELLRIVRESWILAELEAISLFAGVTNEEIRAGRVRARIAALGLEDAAAATKKGRTMTWREIFETHFGEPL